jgi:hypothetical protein
MPWENAMGIRRLLTALALAGACAGPALADVNAQASLGNLGYSVFDLAPGDATAPSLVFGVPAGTPTWHQAFADTQYWVQGPRTNSLTAGTRSSDAVSMRSSFDRPHAALAATLTGRDTPLAPALAMQMQVTSNEENRIKASWNIWSDPIYLTLGAHTRMSFTASLDVFSDALSPGSHLTLFEVLGVLRFTDLFDPNNRQWSDAELLFNGSETENGASVLEQSTLLSLTLDNPNDTPMYLDVQLELNGIGGTVPVSLVPEPAPLAMFAAGGLLLAARRRRKLSA